MSRVSSLAFFPNAQADTTATDLQGQTFSTCWRVPREVSGHTKAVVLRYQAQPPESSFHFHAGDVRCGRSRRQTDCNILQQKSDGRLCQHDKGFVLQKFAALQTFASLCGQSFRRRILANLQSEKKERYVTRQSSVRSLWSLGARYPSIHMSAHMHDTARQYDSLAHNNGTSLKVGELAEGEMSRSIAVVE